jgi:hypothetical protein
MLVKPNYTAYTKKPVSSTPGKIASPWGEVFLPYDKALTPDV